jgi:hypothetical protein
MNSTCAVELDELPDGSVPVSTTGIVSPTSEQEKIVLPGISVSEQLSDEPLSISEVLSMAVLMIYIQNQNFLVRNYRFLIIHDITLNLQESFFSVPNQEKYIT